ncbi:MAG: hypothetical protein MJE77_29040 [Proteobacteria bacterium]|nr:hypothetical protein [Pseudomonadota bacterium]
MSWHSPAPGYEIEEPVQIPTTAHITLTGGNDTAKEWAGQTIIVGEGAGRHAVPVYKFGGSKGKIRASPFFLLGMLPPTKEADTAYEVVELTVLHPEPTRSILEQFRAHLSGRHSYRRNGIRMDMLVHEDAFCLLPEGLSGYYFAMNRGIVDPRVTNVPFTLTVVSIRPRRPG